MMLGWLGEILEKLGPWKPIEKPEENPSIMGSLR